MNILIGFLIVIALIVVLAFLAEDRDKTGYYFWTENAKAIKERNGKRDRYMREYLGYGFDKDSALTKANLRIALEAKAADEVKV